MGTIPKIIVTEEQWIQKGMEQFAQSGAEGLVIEKMSNELACSKSSFYWYFNNRNEFVARVVKRWSDVTTYEVIQRSSAQEKAEDQITHMLTQMFSVTRKGDFLFYLRKLGRASQTYQAILETVEQLRINYAKELLIKTGMKPEVSEQKSIILYQYYLGWYERHKDHLIGEEELHRHVEMLQAQLLRI